MGMKIIRTQGQRRGEQGLFQYRSIGYIALVGVLAEQIAEAIALAGSGQGASAKTRS